jgi:hypothetical protein
MVKCCVLFEIRAEFLNINYKSFSYNQILPSLSQAFTTHHPNVFIPILSLSEGRAGIAGYLLTRCSFFPPQIQSTSRFPADVFSLLLLLYYPTCLSLSVSLQIERVYRATVTNRQHNTEMCFITILRAIPVKKNISVKYLKVTSLAHVLTISNLRPPYTYNRAVFNKWMVMLLMCPFFVRVSLKINCDGRRWFIIYYVKCMNIR